MQRHIDSPKQAIPYGLEGGPDAVQDPDQPQPGRPDLLRAPHLQWPHRSHQRMPGVPTRHRPGIPNLTHHTTPYLIRAGRLKDHLTTTT